MIMEIGTLAKGVNVHVDTKPAYRFITLNVVQMAGASNDPPRVLHAIHIEKTEQNIRKLSALVKLLCAKEGISE